MAIHRILSAVADLFWAPACAACDARIHPEGARPISSLLCPICADSVLICASPMCTRCGLPFGSGAFDHACSECALDPPPFERARAPFAYGGAIAEAVSRFKYGRAPWIAAPLSRLVLAAACLDRPLDAVAPVPLHPRRLRERGFNQAALIASRVSRGLGLPLDTSSLSRIVDTPPQAGGGREERLRGLAGAFRAEPGRLRGARVLLVDDVITTGATARAASAVLVSAGARSVEVLAVARALLDPGPRP